MGGTATLPSEPCTAAWPRTGEIARGELAWNARSHRRWLRRLGPVVAVLLLGATAVLTTGLQGRSQLLLAEGLDENWRGAYDLLVTPADRAPSMCETEQGMRIAPNFVSGTAGFGGLSLDDLEAIRAVEGVEVAAPIGLVGQVGTPGRGLTLTSGFPDSTVALEMESKVFVDDGARLAELSWVKS